MLRLDHITIAAATLAEGVAYTERALGLPIPPGGAHPAMGTHNHLLKLGPDRFLEVIAPDPQAPPPSRPRWFSLDDAATTARLALSPQFITWVVATSDIDAALVAVPAAARPAISVSRGNLTWRIGVPPDGAMPFGGAFPTIIAWPRGPHPATRMPDLGCSLLRFEVAHPEADRIATALAPHFADGRVAVIESPRIAFRALIRTPNGDRQLM